MSEEFGAIDASSFCFGSLQATLPEAPEEFVDALPCGFGWYNQSFAVFQFLFSEVGDIPKT